MKNKIVVAILFLVIIFGLSGCSFIKSSKKIDKKAVKIEKKQKKDVNVVGTYRLIEMNSEKYSYGKKDFKELKENDFEVLLELKDDKTGTLNLFGVNQDLKYDSDYIYSGEEKIEYSLSNNSLTLINGEQVLIFELVK